MTETVYIDTTIKGPSEKDGWCIAVIEHEDKTTRTALSQIHANTNRANVMCLKAALRLINAKADTILIYTTSNYVAQSLSKTGIYQWNMDDWKKKDGTELKYAPHWAAIFEHIRNKEVVVSTEPHSYTKWMQSELERRIDG